MNIQKTFASLTAFALLGGAAILPATASADGYSQHRQAEKNQWRDLAIGSAAVGVIGALSHNNTVATAGALGAIYSGYRYSQDSDYRHDRDWDRDHRRDRDRDRDRCDRDRDRRDRDRDHRDDHRHDRDHDHDRDRGHDHH